MKTTIEPISFHVNSIQYGGEGNSVDISAMAEFSFDLEAGRYVARADGCEGRGDTRYLAALDWCRARLGYELTDREKQVAQLIESGNRLFKYLHHYPCCPGRMLRTINDCDCGLREIANSWRAANQTLKDDAHATDN